MPAYPSPPGRKFPYHKDGTVLFSINETGVVTEQGTVVKERQNGELHAHASVIVGSGNGSLYLGLIFPQLRSIAGYYVNEELNWSGNVARGNIETSVDTTTGTDGAWTQRVAAPFGLGGQEWIANSNTGLNPKPSYRSAIATLVVASVKAIRFRLDSSAARNKCFVNLHVYGEIITTETDQRLRLWHPTLDQELSGIALDFTDVQRLSTPTKTFRIKNNSATLTANSIVVSSTAQTDATPTIVGVTTFDNAGSGYSANQNIGNLAPGAISGVITGKISPGATAVTGLWRQELNVVAGSWS